MCHAVPEEVRKLLTESAVVNFVPDIFRTFGYKLIPLEIDRYGLCTGACLMWKTA